MPERLRVHRRHDVHVAIMAVGLTQVPDESLPIQILKRDLVAQHIVPKDDADVASLCGPGMVDFVRAASRPGTRRRS